MTGDIVTNGRGAVIVTFPGPGTACQIEFKPESARALALLLCEYADRAQAETETRRLSAAATAKAADL